MNKSYRSILPTDIDQYNDTIHVSISLTHFQKQLLGKHIS